MDLKLQNRVALIVGSTRGIGFAVARTLAEEGANVVITGRDPDRLGAAADRLREFAPRVETLAGDVRDHVAVEDMVHAAAARWQRLDALINVVGAAPGGAFGGLSDEDWETALNPKLHGAIRATRAALPALRDSDAGRVVNVAGNAVKTGHPEFVTPAVVNAAVIALTRALARDLGTHGTLVNAVCPGPIETERQLQVRAAIARSRGVSEQEVLKGQVARIPVGRIGQPEDVADLVTYLASPRNRHVNGAVIDIDGGE